MTQAVNVATLGNSLYSDSSGNVGIGTSSPSAKLDVSGSAYVRGDSTNATFTSAGQLAVKRSTGDPVFSFHGNTGAQIGYLQWQDAGVCSVYVGVNQALSFSTNATERMRIDSSGNLVLGTTVNNVFDQVAAARPLVVQSSSSNTTLNGSTNAITICNSDTTTSNSSQLNFATITGASTSQFSAANISCVYGARTNGQYATGTLTFSTSTATNTAPTEKMRIGANGYVYVNTTTGLSPDSAWFSVKSTESSNVPAVTLLGSTGPWVMKIGTVDTGSTRYMIGICNNSSATLGGITTNGTVITYGGTSDYRLKENVQPIVNALEKIEQLNPVTFTWKSNGSIGDGFIAHELQSIFPDAVAGEKDDVEEDGSIKPQMVDQSKLVATLVKAIQEQQELIKQLQADVAALKSK